MNSLPPSRILVTGGAGFIGSHLAEKLLADGHEVVVLDNFLTGKRANLTSFEDSGRFRLIEGDIRDFAVCRRAAAGCDYVLHEAALGSVPRSLENPQLTLEINAQGFVNVIEAARGAGVKRFVYASSSSVYGDDTRVPKVEECTGKALSPYALSKQMNEYAAENYSRVFGLETIGLRYFNVFGPRQDPAGAYAAVIPKFIGKLLNHERPVINGDGSYSRDFTCVGNVVQANLAALAAPEEAANTVYNIACGERTTLTELFEYLRENLAVFDAAVTRIEPQYSSNRAGDIPHSLASVARAERRLGFHPGIPVCDGLGKTVKWYFKNFMEPHDRKLT